MNIIAPPNVKEFLEKRVRSIVDKIGDVTFVVKDEDPRSINFSSDLSTMTISAAGINNLSNSFNKIGLLQAFYRFIGFHSVSMGTFLLHCSSAPYEDKSVIFGDHGKAGKTLSSVELGLFSREYLADEFVFWDSVSGEIFSDEEIPMHLRSEVREHLSQRHQIKDSAEFVSNDFLKFNWNERKLLSLICYTTFTKEPEQAVVLTKLQAVDYARTTLSAHAQKMFNTTLDRFQFITMTDNTSQNIKANNMESTHSKEYQKLFPIFNQAAERLVDRAPSIEIFTDDPCRIPYLIKSIL